MSEPIGGMIAATLTPFDASGRVDTSVVEAHVDLLARGGLDGVAPAGTTGEFLYLSPEERARVAAAAVRGAAGRLRVIAGIWDLTAEGVGRLARAAESAGADAVLLTTPIYYPASDEAIVAWYHSARNHTGLPLYAYSIPQYAANAVSIPALRRLHDDGTIQGIKDSTGKPDRLRELLAGREGPAVFAASDSFASTARGLGAHGFISALANIFPATFMRIWNGDADAQAAIDQVRAAVKGFGGIGGLKTLMRLRGLDFGRTRLPFGDLLPDDQRALLELAKSLKQMD